jgi:hypothetical protein
VRCAHHEVGDGEHDRLVAEGLGNGERDDQHRRHRHEHHQPDRALVGGQEVRQP